jgi:protein TonB
MAQAISTPMLSRRAAVFAAIVALHVGFIYVLNIGLATQMVEVVFGPIETKMIEEVKDTEEKPPPPPPKIETTPPPFVPPPDIAIDLPTETTTTTAITATTVKPVAKPPPPAQVNRVPPRQNAKRPCATYEEDYPPQSKRLGEEGVTTVRFTVLENGSVADVSIVKSSGFERLDQATLRLMKRCRYLPGTENGKAVSMSMDQPVRWQIKK